MRTIRNYIQIGARQNTRANGLTAIAVLIALSKHSNQANTQLKHITHALKNITTKVRMNFPYNFSSAAQRDPVAQNVLLHYILV